MARIQVLPLHTETVGAVSSTPFVLIIDSLADSDPQYTDDVLAEVRADTGARTILVVAGELTVANVDEKLHDAAQAAVLRALHSERTLGA